MPRPLSRGERKADLWVNGLAIVAGLIGAIVLMAVAIPQGSLTLTLSVLVYSYGLLAMLVCSALYNGGSPSPRKDLLRRLDHAAIFVMIAGTYTSFLAVKMYGGWSRWLLLYVWAVAGLGVALKLIWVKRFGTHPARAAAEAG
jgi:hemolysin III